MRVTSILKVRKLCPINFDWKSETDYVKYLNPIYSLLIVLVTCYFNEGMSDEIGTSFFGH